MSNIKFLDLLERISGKSYDLESNLDLSSAQLGALESICNKNKINFDFELSQKGKSIRECLNNDIKIQQKKLEISSEFSKKRNNTKGINRTISQIGCDIQANKEIKRLIDIENINNSDFVKKYYSKYEIDYCLSQNNPIQSFAGLFAAKEAIYKIGLENTINNIVIFHEDGKPICSGYNISISHSDEFSIAVALLL